MCLYKILLKKNIAGIVESVVLIFRIVCHISGLDNVSYKVQKSYRHFQIKTFCFCVSVVLIGAKGYCQNICFNKGFVCNRNFNNCAAELNENSTNSLKVETRTKQSALLIFYKHKF